MALIPAPEQNHLLAALPREAQLRLRTHLELVDMPWQRSRW